MSQTKMSSEPMETSNIKAKLAENEPQVGLRYIAGLRERSLLYHIRSTPFL